MKRIMIGLDFNTVNFQNAMRSLKEWSVFAMNSRRYEIVFGISTYSDRKVVLDMIRKSGLSTFCPILACWDNEVSERTIVMIKAALAGNKTVSGYCHSAGIAFPFYPVFNYGSLLNRLLMLAFFLTSDYLVRIDPGTLPPTIGSFDEITDKLIETIVHSGDVVSFGYEHRLALRDMFVKDRTRHEKLIHEYTHIDIIHQVTGGAMFLSRVPGIPAIPFDSFGPGNQYLTLVWGSDDAFYKLIKPGIGNIRLLSPLIPRFDPEGMRKTTIQYYRGIAGMVYLSTLIDKTDADALKKLADFIEILKFQHLDSGKYRPNTENVSWEQEFIMENITPEPFLAKIREGLANYQALVSGNTWITIVTLLRDRLKADILLKGC